MFSLLKSSSFKLGSISVSATSQSVKLLLLESYPLQSPYAGIHFKPLLLQVHEFVPHVLQDIILQLQRVIFKISSGAGT